MIDNPGIMKSLAVFLVSGFLLDFSGPEITSANKQLRSCPFSLKNQQLAYRAYLVWTQEAEVSFGGRGELLNVEGEGVCLLQLQVTYCRFKFKKKSRL